MSRTCVSRYAVDDRRARGQAHSIADPAGTTAFSLYDANGLLKEISDPFSNTKVIYTYDTAGRVTQRTDGGKLCLTQTYETDIGRVDTRTIRGGGTNCSGSIHASLNLDYDLASNVTRRVETLTGNSFAGTYNYTYDEANRLKTVAGPANFGTRTYDYDGGGNRTSVQVNANPAVTTTYNAASLPESSSDGTTYSHDQVGDLTAIDRTGGSNDWFFSYSSWNQLTKAERSPGSADVTYTLDAIDRVLSRASTGATSQYTYQGSGEVLAKAVVGGSTTTYAHTPGGPLAQKVGNTKRYYLRDLHGDLVGWSDTNGGLQGTALYDPWGELLSGSGEMATIPANGAFRFQGDLTDSATGQVDMLTRMYEPTLGRFSSRDVLFGEAMSPVSLNQYVYSMGNPVTYADPSGMRPECGDCSTRAEGEGLQVWASHAAEHPPITSTPPPPGVSVPHVALPMSGYIKVLNNDQYSWRERAEYAEQLIARYPEDGAVAVMDWLEDTFGVHPFDSELGISTWTHSAYFIQRWSDGEAAIWWHVRALRNRAATVMGLRWGARFGADCRMRHHALWTCYGMPAGTYGGSGTTFGNVFVTPATSEAAIPPERFVHETIHSDQWAEYGEGYGALYLFYGGLYGECNPFEQQAGYFIGGYRCPQVSTWPQGPP